MEMQVILKSIKAGGEKKKKKKKKNQLWKHD